MPIVQHKFLNHQVSQDTEILILGTFNPDIPEGPDFFYGRPRNYLWQLMPGCWELDSLKDNPLPDKLAFMAEYKIDFADLIASVDVPAGLEGNVDDAFIDGLVNTWKDIIGLLNELKNLKAVYFTRITFNDVPNIQQQIITIHNHCLENDIRFCCLKSPSRFANAAKQQQWIDTIINQVTCTQA
jgi:hypothetical protein